ncbi:hypothetical protein AB0D08_30655 [Kitasatospora sp. NPDC048540]|uniref:hypothetical protein n=1 Tax=Kitasatospora sp. NPDC048540 TaxID=3155634 RepID=UPI00340CEB8A
MTNQYVDVSSPSGTTLARRADPSSARFHLVNDEEVLTIDHPDEGKKTYKMQETLAIGGLTKWLTYVNPELPDEPFNQVRAAVAARDAALALPDNGDLALFGRLVLRFKRSARWTEAVSTALLGDWITPLHDGTGLGLPALDQLRKEGRTIHTQLVPLWERRTYGNRRVLQLEKPSVGGGTLRDLLADRHLPDDPLLDQVPGDRRLAAVLQQLAPDERAVVLALGYPGIITWPEAAEHAGSPQPEKDGERVRRKVDRVVRELRRRDGQRVDGPSGLWTPARNGGAR